MDKGYFNSYKEDLNLEFLRRYCTENGEARLVRQGDFLEKAGEPARWIAYVEEGYFKYMVHNEREEKDYCTGFAFEGEFVADYPYCLTGRLSEVSIKAGMDCRVHVIDAADLQRMYEEDSEKMCIGKQITESLFRMVYSRFLDFYRHDAKERYALLLRRCPQIVHILSLKDIASYLNITPTHMSRIRREIAQNEDVLKNLTGGEFLSFFSEWYNDCARLHIHDANVQRGSCHR